MTKYWLGNGLGERGLTSVQPLVHRLKQMLTAWAIPLIQTDGDASLAGAVLAHWGHWGEIESERGPRRRWLPLPALRYVQVIKRRSGRRLVSVKRRIVNGDRALIRAGLAAHGWQINTAFIERFNLTLRQHVPGLQRQGLALARSADRLQEQLGLVQMYYNFCLPHRSLGDRQQPVTPAMAVGFGRPGVADGGDMADTAANPGAACSESG